MKPVLNPVTGNILGYVKGEGGNVTEESAPTVAMDEYVDLVRRWREATKARLGWTKIEEDLKLQIEKILGEQDKGLINGEEAVVRERINRFGLGEFKKAEPELARFFEHEVTVREIDVELIKRTRPDIWERFQVTRLLNKFDA